MFEDGRQRVDDFLRVGSSRQVVEPGSFQKGLYPRKIFLPHVGNIKMEAVQHDGILGLIHSRLHNGRMVFSAQREQTQDDLGWVERLLPNQPRVISPQSGP